MTPNHPNPIASIIVPCFNQREFTQLCFQSLFRHTRPAWELIVIDNGSTDETAVYLAGVRDAAAVPVTIISNPRNVGFPGAINQGLQAASGEYLVLLNNDAVVTDGWLDQLIALTAVRVESEVRETSGPDDGGVGRPAPNEETSGPDDGRVGRPAPNGDLRSGPGGVGRPAPNEETSGPDDGGVGRPAPNEETSGPDDGRVGRPAPNGDLRSGPGGVGRPAPNGDLRSGPGGVGRPAPNEETSGPDDGGVGRPAPNEDLGSGPRRVGRPAPNGDLRSGPGGVGRPAPNKEANSQPPLAPPSQGVESSVNRRAQPGSTIGLVGPVSNYATPPQWVENVPYRDLDEMHVFARRWREEHRGQWFTVSKLSGFCLLMKRVVYESIGGLDERFGLGFFDDDDLAERARRAGFELAVAHDLFVHHFGSRTFVGNGIDAGALLEENARRFAAKWGQGTPRGRRVTLRAFEPHSALRGDPLIRPSGTFSPRGEGDKAKPRILPVGPSTAPRIEGKTRISLTMIVRDEQENLPACLGSVRGIFDEVVVVDTGSKDRTREIARDFGARVFEFAWIDDFAAARNEALSHATGDYAFWLDADDVVDPPERENLLRLLDGLRLGEPAGYVVR